MLAKIIKAKFNFATIENRKIEISVSEKIKYLHTVTRVIKELKYLHTVKTAFQKLHILFSFL